MKTRIVIEADLTQDQCDALVSEINRICEIIGVDSLIESNQFQNLEKCQHCNSDRVYLTNAVHCSRCAITTEI